ncbi:hypothetical protein QUF58_07120 [Anaerolineales bacterium HSG24]|nr:hypothetical protein [Anaerolineales bacterium HSG24]
MIVFILIHWLIIDILVISVTWGLTTILPSSCPDWYRRNIIDDYPEWVPT